eukprot:gnl/TRDRNA2_/TRDRNA2_166911_c0_seq3.p1 gnl/TRDRNA2_/TRDRNA2_166911_c0~~gnl/TRDRNA2_/TRDRNA2_166911_c0_seq3.p1  ORF type:complete len:196 (-),score=12.32 gnl/TRDRNA2_/TRDRNA2_166911_c0_seq3:133-633(-)
MIVDRELGEVYGPSVLGSRQPRYHLRLKRSGFDYCDRNGIDCHRKQMGKTPSWGEDLRQARRRYVSRFLSFLRRSVISRQNFVIVSHGECVGATLSIMPSYVDQRVVKVSYGGGFLAVRERHQQEISRPRRHSAPDLQANIDVASIPASHQVRPHRQSHAAESIRR